jgi:16S rRNA G966 N2-methylase RsmD
MPWTKTDDAKAHHRKPLFYGDNLNVMRENISDETIDLVYLDPPFNSQRGYNLLFRTPKGHESGSGPLCSSTSLQALTRSGSECGLLRKSDTSRSGSG